mmetsp:Transcript_11514/g.24258  ORF Transcript_11514/g.24258 Transcript_11514/m.24258 type:complete len:204 (-) Transcript_11514:635-1246(-)
MNGVIITTSENHIMECIIYYTFFFANQVVHRIIILVIHQGLFLHLSVMGMEIGDLAIVSFSIRLIVMSLISFEFMCSVHFTSESFARTVAAIRILGSPIINHGVYFLHDDLVVVLPAMDSFRIIIIIIIIYFHSDFFGKFVRPLSVEFFPLILRYQFLHNSDNSGHCRFGTQYMEKFMFVKLNPVLLQLNPYSKSQQLCFIFV